MALLTSDLIDAAYGFSIENRPGSTTTEDTELVGVLNRELTRLFALAASEDETVFAEVDQVAYSAEVGGWRRPAFAERVWRIEKADGTEVVVVPVDDRGAEEGSPALYTVGKIYYAAGNDLDPVSTDTLTFFYSIWPHIIGAADENVDELFPDGYGALLTLALAAYLAEADGREAEAARLRQEAERWEALFVAHVAGSTSNLRRRFGHAGNRGPKGG